MNNIQTILSFIWAINVLPVMGRDYPAFEVTNFNPPEIDAPIMGPDEKPLEGPYFARLYVGATQSSLEPVLPSALFGFGDGAGYFVGGALEARNVGFNQLVWAQVKVWNANLGATFEIAEMRNMGGYGTSKPFQVWTRSVDDVIPSYLKGLESFSILPVVPEPGTKYLLGLGVALIILTCGANAKSI